MKKRCRDDTSGYRPPLPSIFFPIVSPQPDSKFHVDLENSRNRGRLVEEQKKKKKGERRWEGGKRRFIFSDLILWIPLFLNATLSNILKNYQARTFTALNCFFDREFRKKKISYSRKFRNSIFIIRTKRARWINKRTRVVERDEFRSVQKARNGINKLRHSRQNRKKEKKKNTKTFRGN